MKSDIGDGFYDRSRSKSLLSLCLDRNLNDRSGCYRRRGRWRSTRLASGGCGDDRAARRGRFCGARPSGGRASRRALPAEPAGREHRSEIARRGPRVNVRTSAARRAQRRQWRQERARRRPSTGGSLDAAAPVVPAPSPHGPAAVTNERSTSTAEAESAISGCCTRSVNVARSSSGRPRTGPAREIGPRPARQPPQWHAGGSHPPTVSEYPNSFHRRLFLDEIL